MQFEYKIKGGDFSEAGTISSKLKKILKQLNIDNKIIKKVVIALYEAEVNVIAHAYNGKVNIDIDTEKIEINIKDKGPGIENIAKAMEKGFSTATSKVREMGFGAGMGLPNIKKNSDKLDIKSKVSEGTNLKIITFLNK
ncbi:MAG: anti-sigma regulatory factor [Bacteroidales bacterium]|nr:anti-sigma regulatory factor [Bacteroidales bacterium]